MARSAVPRVLALAWILAIAVPLLIPATSVGLTKAMNIVPTMDDEEYTVGSWAIITTHVLNFGVHEDATTIEVYMNRGRPNERALGVQHTDRGVYVSTFQILASDPIQEIVRVFVTASIGTLDDYGLLSFYVDRLTVDVSAEPSRGAPGSWVAVTTHVLDGQQPRDADYVSLRASVLNVGGVWESTDLVLARRAVGTYFATYAIPETIEQDTVVAFSASVAAETTVFGSALVLVDVPTTLVVWSHGHSLESKGGVLDILVANETGWPVGGAAVSLNYDYYDARGYHWNWKVSGTTDERGVASFNLVYVSARGFVYFWGQVSAGSLERGFEGTIPVPESKPLGMLDIRRENQIDAFEPGEIATLRYSVLRNGTALQGQAIYYYAHSREELVASGAVTTDAWGRFEVTLSVPLGVTTIDFASKAGDVWLYKYDVVYAARALPLTIGPIFVGSVTRLSASLPSVSGPYLTFVALLPYERDGGSVEFPWGLANGARAVYDLVVSDGGRIEYDLVVPRFLPKGEDYLLYVYASPQSVADAQPYVYSETIRIENVLPTPVWSVSSSRIVPGWTLEVDASASFDLDGTVAAYEVDWGDGTGTGWMEDPTASHAFSRAGDYDLTIRVRDDNGGVSEFTYGVTVGASALVSPPAEQLIVVAGLASTASVAFALALRHVLRPSPTRQKPEASRRAEQGAEQRPSTPRPPQSPPSE